MDSGAPFSMVVITCDRKKQQGGEWLHINEAVKHEPITKEQRYKLSRLQPASDMVRKNPRHYENSTRNIRMKGGEIRKIHLRLVRQFNGAVVL